MTFVNLCSVYSPDRKRLFPIAAVDKKLSGGISRWPFPAHKWTDDVTIEAAPPPKKRAR